MPSPFSWVLAVVALLWLSLPLPVLPVLVLAVWPVWLLLSASELQNVILLTFRELNAEILYTLPMHFLYTDSPVNKMKDILL